MTHFYAALTVDGVLGACKAAPFGISGLLNPLSDHQGGEKELLHPHKMTWGDSPAQTLVVPDQVLMKVR